MTTLKVAGLFAPLLALTMIGAGISQLFGPGAALLTIGLLIWVDHYMPSALRPVDDKPKPGTPGVKIGRVPVPPPFGPHEPMRR